MGKKGRGKKGAGDKAEEEQSSVSKDLGSPKSSETQQQQSSQQVAVSEQSSSTSQPPVAKGKQKSPTAEEIVQPQTVSLPQQPEGKGKQKQKKKQQLSQQQQPTSQQHQPLPQQQQQQQQQLQPPVGAAEKLKQRTPPSEEVIQIQSPKTPEPSVSTPQRKQKAKQQKQPTSQQQQPASQQQQPASQQQQPLPQQQQQQLQPPVGAAEKLQRTPPSEEVIQIQSHKTPEPSVSSPQRKQKAKQQKQPALQPQQPTLEQIPQQKQLAPQPQKQFPPKESERFEHSPQRQVQQQKTAWSGQQQQRQQATQPIQQQTQQLTGWRAHQTQQETTHPGQQASRGRGRGRGRNLQQAGDQQQISASEQQLQQRGQRSGFQSPSPSDSSLETGLWRKPQQPRASTSGIITGKVEEITSTLKQPGYPLQKPQTEQKPVKTQQATKIEGGKTEVKKYDLDIPQRKNLRKGGTLGQLLTVETNHVSLNIAPKFETAIHYDVQITPDKPKRLMRRVWEEFRKQYLPNSPVAFDDFKNAYSPRPLFDNDFSGEVTVSEDAYTNPKIYVVAVKYAANVNLKELFNYMAAGGKTAVPQEALQCIDIVLRNCSALRFVKVGRSFFSQPSGRVVKLGDGLELWHGFFQSAVIGWKPFLNVDVAHKGFPIEQTMPSLIAEISSEGEYTPYNEGEINDYKFSQIQTFIKGLKILYELPGQPGSRRSYRVNGLKEIPERAVFTVENDQKTTVYEYYLKKKNYRIKYNKLPVLWVGPRDRYIYLPPELCTIMPNQVINRKLNEIQTQKMVRNAATSTDDRKAKILNSLKLANFNADPVVSAFGLNVGHSFEQVRARLLSPPKLKYQREIVSPQKGTWRSSTFLTPSTVHYWTIINLDRRTNDENLNRFAKNLKQDARRIGINMEDAVYPYFRLNKFDRITFKEIMEKLKAKKASIVFVIIPDNPQNIYHQVKQIAELSVGVLTQCIKSKTMFKMSAATIGNLLLKVNSKLNGTNHTIADICRPKCLSEPCMIMGADVTHPSPDQNDIPSVAAVTASCDPTAAFKYNFCWRLQQARHEIIVDLEEIVKEQLYFFYQQTRQKPSRIIFFRDGVSEGQFREVMNVEVQAIRKACKSMPGGEYRPPITFLVVQKRHHTRFFPNKGETDDRNNNVRAGTVVDTDITHPTDIEYYLVSHASIQGVARPTKYRVLWDDAEMSEDDLQNLTYYLCHMFSRCTRSVSYPAPTYYAHLAAFRARAYLDGSKINLDNLQQEQNIRRIKQEICKGFPMFFV